MPVHVTAYGRTDVGLVRRLNEDAFVVADLTGKNLLQEPKMARLPVGESGVLLAVSDGLGGHKAGEVASALVVRSLERSLSQRGPGLEPDAVLEQATIKANREVWQAAREPGREQMGATLTALYVRDGTAHIAEVGDSRAYLLRGGVLRQVTHDQSYVQLMLDTGVMTPEEAAQNPNSNIILQAVGLKPDVKVALGRLELRQRDCFVLCSDGLWNKVADDEIRSTILSAQRLDVACNRLVDMARDRGGEDNITVILAGVAGLEGELPALTTDETISDTFSIVKEFEAVLPRPRPAHAAR